MLTEKVTGLESQVHSLQQKLSQLERSLKLSENEQNSIQEQHEAKTLSLDEAIKEIENMRRDRNSEETESDKRQRRIEELNIEVDIYRIPSSKHMACYTCEGILI